MSKATLKNIAKNLKKSSKVHAKQSKQIENIMKKSPAKNISPQEIFKRTGLTPKLARQAAGPGSRGTLPTFKSRNRPYSKKKKAGLPTNKNILDTGVNKAASLKLKKSPALVKLSAGCKAMAKRKFKVYPSAYANMYAAKMQRKGKC